MSLGYQDMMKLLLSVAEVMSYTKRIISPQSLEFSEKKSYLVKENEVSHFLLMTIRCLNALLSQKSHIAGKQ